MNLESFRVSAAENRVFACAIRFLLAAILSGSQIFGGYAPFALGFVAAAGAGMEGLSALLGLLVGTMLFMPFTEAMKYISAAVLIFSVSVAFYDTRFYQRTSFLPLTTAACTAAVGFVYLSRSGIFSTDGAYFLLEVLLSGGCALAYQLVLENQEPPQDLHHQTALFLLALTLLIAIAAIPLATYFSLGRILAAVLVLYAGRTGGAGTGCAAGLCAGLAMDTAADTLFFSMSYPLSALLASAGHCGRSTYTLLFILGSLVSLFWAGDAPAVYGLLENCIAGILFLLLPDRLFHRVRMPKKTAPEPPRHILEQQLRSASAVFRSLYDHLTHSTELPINDENIATVFDRAADQVCRSCPLCSTCWDADYVTTYNALNDTTASLTSRGHLLPADLPTHFTDRCTRLAQFIAAVNVEFNAMMIRRQYNRQLDSTRQNAKEQYARLSELLSDSADRLRRESEESVAALAPLSDCEICTEARPKAGQMVCGDTLATFRTDDGKLCLLLSDGMGCGEAARRESAMTVRLLQQFLQAGIEASTALRTLNTALSLHSDESGAFTTIDLMTLQPQSGDATFYKYGAAPSYIKHGTSIRRITGGVFPAGLRSTDLHAPEATAVHLSPGDFVVLISDGFADSLDDGWLQVLLAGWDGVSVTSLTTALMDASQRRSGRSDDASVLVLRLPPLPSATPV